MYEKQSNEEPGNQSGWIEGLADKGVKRKFKVHSIEKEFQAITEVEKDRESKATIAKKFEVPPNTLSTWLKNAEKIKESYEQRVFGPNAKKCAQSPTKTQKMLPYSSSKQHETETCQCLVLYYKQNLRSSLLSPARQHLIVYLLD